MKQVIATLSAALTFSVAAHSASVVQAKEIKQMICTIISENHTGVLVFTRTSPSAILQKSPDLEKSEIWDSFKKSEALFYVDQGEPTDKGLNGYFGQLYSMSTSKTKDDTLKFDFIAGWKASGSVTVTEGPFQSLYAIGTINEKSHIRQLKCSINKN